MATSGKPMTDKEKADAARYVRERKLSVSEGARHLGLSRPTLRKILKNPC